jgi:hypothetical protein
MYGDDGMNRSAISRSGRIAALGSCIALGLILGVSTRSGGGLSSIVVLSVAAAIAVGIAQQTLP